MEGRASRAPRSGRARSEGGLMLAIFQVPNKFFDRDGRTTDITGSDWERCG
jgi:hypothetical protein